MPASKRAKTQLAKNLIKYRKTFGFTQQKVSDIIGIKRSTYGYYEIDTYPPLAIMKKIANMYKISIDELTGDSSGDTLVDLPRPEIFVAAQPEVDYNPTVSSSNADETELLMLYRILPTEQRLQIKEVLHNYIKKLES